MFWRDSNSASVLQTKSGSYEKKQNKRKKIHVWLCGDGTTRIKIYIYIFILKECLQRQSFEKFSRVFGGNFVEMNRN